MLTEWYTAMADVYDDLVRVTDDISFFVERAHQARGPVLELMAGTGRLSIPLAEAGAELTCLDRSAPMLERLHRKLIARGVQAKVIEADARQLPLPAGAYALVILGFQSFAELVDVADRHMLLEEVYRVLSPDGRFICTLHNPAVRVQTLDPAGEIDMPFHHGGQSAKFHASLRFDRTTGIVSGSQTLTFLDPAGEVRDERRFEVRFALIERDWFEEAATGHRFLIEALYGDYDREPFAENSPYMIWILRKPSTQAIPD